MDFLLMQISNLMLSTSHIIAQAGEEPVTYDKIGFIVLEIGRASCRERVLAGV